MTKSVQAGIFNFVGVFAGTGLYRYAKGDFAITDVLMISIIATIIGMLIRPYLEKKDSKK